MRDILHCDLNSFFASVECLKRPELKNVPMAVCGDPSTRHGIILAKNELAKKYGVTTAETIYTAKKKCKNLVLVKSNHDDYIKYSKLVNKIYLKYSDMVEPFGIDESFIDVTHSTLLFGSPYEIANSIKEEIKNTIGLTISVGVSFNKSLAKLGSDLKKPDAITEIKYKNFHSIINSLPANSLLYVGKKTEQILKKIGICTIGDITRYSKENLVKKLGKLGEVIHNYASGLDFEEVRKFDDIQKPQSVSNGITFDKDTSDIKKIEEKIRILSDMIASTLRQQNLQCTTVRLQIKNNMFTVISRQKKVNKTDLFQDISNVAIDILNDNFIPNEPIRAITVSASNLISPNDVVQLDFFNQIEVKNADNINKVNLMTAVRVVDEIKKKYGNHVITFGSLIK